MTAAPAGHASGKAAAPSLPILAANVLRRLGRNRDWRREIDGLLAEMGPALGSHRAILFRLVDVPGKGVVQSIASYWTDDSVPGIADQPTIIAQEVVDGDALLHRIAEEIRQGKLFVGHTREIEGFLRRDFESQKILSFISAPIFVHGQLWGTLAFNDCVAEHVWSDDEHAVIDIAATAIGEAAERELSEEHVSENIRRAMMDYSLDAVLVIDETGAVVEYNPAAERMLGWRREEILGRDVLATLIPEFYREGYANGGEYMRGRGSPMVGSRVETLSRTKSGDLIPVEITATELHFADRRLFLGSIRDLTEKRRAEEEINRQRERLHQNEKMAAMGSLLAGVSHELNNPLAVVVAQSTLLHEFAPDTPTKVRAEKVRAAAERCGRIVKSFLGMVRLQQSSHTYTDLNKVVRSAMEVTAYGARSGGIVIESEFALDPPGVMGDADHLTQVVANLLVNSQHALAGQAGERRVRVSTRARGGLARVCVEDNGPGVADDLKERIFESYFTTKAVGVGTGIGLSISRSIVDRHKGRIWVEDVATGGARFVVELPAVAAGGADAATIEERRGVARALIIDDEADVAGSLADMLQLMGVSAAVLTEWHGAAAELQGTKPDIVFCDLRMPGLTGMQILRDILDHDLRYAGRFVLVTGDMLGARVEVDAVAPELRPHLLEKPFSMLDVRNVLSLLGDGLVSAK